MSGENQATIGAWIDATFPGGVAGSPRKALRALEEVIELCFASGADRAAIWATVEKAFADAAGKSRKGDVPTEAADVLIVLYGLAHLEGFDLHEAVDRKQAINRSRKWRPAGDGCGYHVKEN